MEKILNIIKNSNKQKILSIFAANGIGKTTLANKINFTLTHEDYRKIEHDNLIEGFDSYAQDPPTEFHGDFNPHEKPKPTYNSINIDNILDRKNNILLPKSDLTILMETSFSYNLISPHNVKRAYGESFLEKYIKLEKNMEKISFTIDQQLIVDSIYFCNSTDIQVDHGFLFRDQLGKFAIIIEYISSLIKMPIENFLELCFDEINFKNNIVKKVENIYTKINNDIENYEYRYGNTYELIKKVEDLIDMLYKVLPNKELINYFKEIDSYNRKKYPTCKSIIQNRNSNIETKFLYANKIFFKYFPKSFNNIELNKRYNSSLDLEIYDFIITNKANKRCSQFNFLNNIGSEAEVKLINFLYLIILILGLQNDIKYLITSDDALDSFDYTNSSNIYRVLKMILENKSYVFLNLTHNFEQFQDFNKIFKLSNDDIYIMNRKQFSKVTLHSVEEFTLTSLPITNNFYTDYLCEKRENHLSVQDQIISLIAIIPYFRNIIQMAENSKDIRVKMATSLLHLKDNKSTNLIQLLDESIFKKFIFKPNKRIDIENYCKLNSNYDLLLSDLYQFIINNNLDVELLEYKIFLSIYIRVYIEKIMANILNIDLTINPKSKYQTGELIQDLKNYLLNHQDQEVQEILEQIQYLNEYIPDYIHNEISHIIHLNSHNMITGLNNLNKIYMQYLNKNNKII